MATPKHSYIFTKDFVLCCLSEDQRYFYGEIIYGKKVLKNVKVAYINGKKYYKYWELESMRKKHQTIVGKKTNYERYIKSTKMLYPQNYYSHKLIGNLFRVSKNNIIKIITPKSYEELNENQKKIFNLLIKRIYLSKNSVLVGGSILLLGKINSTDFDIIVNGKKEGIKASKWVDKITNNKRNKISIGTKGYHPRRFRLGNVIICPFAIHMKDNFFEFAKFKRVKDPKKVNAKVTNCSESLFSPSVYKIKTKKDKNYFLISYFVGHNHLFRKNDIIEFKAPLYEFYAGNTKKSVYVIPVQGSWIDLKREINE